MRLSIFAILSLLISTLGYSQNEAYNPYKQIQVGQQYYLIADRVNVRAMPSSNATITGKLALGSSLQVEEKSSEELVIEGLNAPWYRISFQENGQRKSGYIWGGFMALGHLQSQEDPNTLFLYGFSRQTRDMVNGYPRTQTYMQVRACRQNQELSKLEFPAIGLLSTGIDASISNNKGVKGIRNILQFSFSDGYCGGAFGMQVVFWDGLQLHHIRKLDNGFDIPYFRHEYFIYPNDNLGVEGLIIFQMEEGKYDDNGDPQYDQKIRKEFSWKDAKLQLLDMGDNQP